MNAHQVWKQPIPVDGAFELLMPRGARVLTVQVQGTIPCVWMLVDPAAAPERRRFRLAGTGHPIENAADLDYVGTFQIHGGALVFHLFEKPAKPEASA
jgi:hypothetical protein